MGTGDLWEDGAPIEVLFEHFGVAYDPQVLAVHRLHILRRFGLMLAAAADASPSRDATGRPGAAEILASAYAQCAAGTAGRAAVFPGLRGRLVTLRRKSGAGRRDPEAGR